LQGKKERPRGAGGNEKLKMSPIVKEKNNFKTPAEGKKKKGKGSWKTLVLLERQETSAPSTTRGGEK